MWATTTSAQVRQTFTFTWTSKKLGTGRVGHSEWSQNLHCRTDQCVSDGKGKKRVTWCNMVDSQKQLYSQVVTLKLNTQQCQACNCYTVRHFENHSENHLYWVWESLCIQFKNCKSLLWITLRIAFRNSQRVEHEVKAFKKNPWYISQSGAIWCNLAQDQSFIETGWNWSVLLDTYFESL